MARTERGLLLTCLWYIREVDPQTLLLTGLTRDGIYLVENGEVSGAVNNFRFNESPVGMLGRLAEVGATVPTLPREWGDYFTRCAMPAGPGRGLQHVVGQPGQLARDETRPPALTPRGRRWPARSPEPQRAWCPPAGRRRPPGGPGRPGTRPSR